jgi:hypothetical protein
MRRPGINFRLFFLIFPNFGKNTMAATLDSKWRILGLRKFKDHMLRRNQLNYATSYQLLVFWLGLFEFRKNRHGRHTGIKMAHIMTQKIQGGCATLKSVKSVDQVSISGFLARFFRISEKRPWSPSWIQNGSYYDPENSRRMCYVEIS